MIHISDFMCVRVISSSQESQSAAEFFFFFFFFPSNSLMAYAHGINTWPWRAKTGSLS